MKVRPAGEGPEKHAYFTGPMPPPLHVRDPVDKSRPKRPCARCGQRFQPTYKHRMLCARCYGLGGGYDE